MTVQGDESRCGVRSIPHRFFASPRPTHRPIKKKTRRREPAELTWLAASRPAAASDPAPHDVSGCADRGRAADRPDDRAYQVGLGTAPDTFVKHMAIFAFTASLTLL